MSHAALRPSCSVSSSQAAFSILFLFYGYLVPSSRSKPTAFQAVSFQPTARWWGGPPGPRGSPRTRFRTASQRPRRGKTTKRPTWALAPISGGGLGVRPTTNHALTSGSGGFSRNPAFSRNPTHRLIGGGCLVQIEPSCAAAFCANIHRLLTGRLRSGAAIPGIDCALRLRLSAVGACKRFVGFSLRW